MKVNNLISTSTINIKTVTATELLSHGVTGKELMSFMESVKRETPDFYKKCNSLKNEKDILTLTDADFSQFELESQAWEDKFNDATNMLRRYFKFLNDQAGEMLEGSSKKYYAKTSFKHSSYPGVSTSLSILKDYKRSVINKKIKEEAEAIARGEIITEEMLEAAEYIATKGKTGFKIQDSVKVANEIRFEELVAEAFGTEQDIKCCDDCSSWTAGEHRCSCGNRRMHWESEGNFKNMIIYPDAH